MAITFNDARILWHAKQKNVSFDHILTISHLNLYLHHKEINFFQKEYAKFYTKNLQSLNHYRFGDYSDDFLTEFLQVKRLETMDNSAYEQATIIHDLNQPIPSQLYNQFDAIIDAGSLEHIFNFPVAIKNLMSMVKIGGLVFITTPANNLFGHGFYQFSPELMYRVFSEDNGFKINNVWLWESIYPSVEFTPARQIYKVIDPAQVGTRVTLQTSKPVMMMVEAKKIAECDIFEKIPQQSDYTIRWNQKSSHSLSKHMSKQIKLLIWNRIPLRMQLSLLGRMQLRRFSFTNRKFYKKYP